MFDLSKIFSIYHYSGEQKYVSISDTPCYQLILNAISNMAYGEENLSKWAEILWGFTSKISIHEDAENLGFLSRQTKKFYSYAAC